MKVAIVGAGFSGLAVAWHLFKKKSDLEIVLFDPLGISGGTSGMAAGLMHPFSGAHAKLNWCGLEGYEATSALLKIASEAINLPVAYFSGLYRLAVTEEQHVDFKFCSERYSETQWKSSEEIKRVLPQLQAYPGIFIPSAVTVNSPLYLQGLWKACQKFKIRLEKKCVQNIEELNGFDAIVIATGAASKQFSECRNLPITAVKGQILEMEWNISPLIAPINSHTYVVMNGSSSCIVGASYERDFSSSLPDVKTAKNHILPKTLPYLPYLAEANVIDCRAGMRASTPDHRPIVKQLSNNCYVITGMGSKGLLYHALFGEQLAGMIVTSFV